MDTNILQAKQFIKTQNFRQAISVILEIINSNTYKDKYKLYFKLGDIHETLGEFILAKEYYQKSINECNQNIKAFFRLARLLHQHLHDNEQSQNMYEKCLKINPNHSPSMFYLGKLMLQNNQLSQAKIILKRCLHAIDAKASVYFQLAIALRKQAKPNDQQNIEYLLFNALTLQPSIIKYRVEFAIYSQEIKKYHQANHSYKIAIDMANEFFGGDPLLLAQYAAFLSQCMNHHEKALKYIEQAYKLDYKYKYEYLNFQKYDLTYNKSQYHIKFIIYDFNVIIYKKYSKIDNLKTKDLYFFFGGLDRINKLKEYFDQILYYKVQNVILTTTESSDIIYKLLDQLGLSKYFKIIIGHDVTHFMMKSQNINQNKVYGIIKIKDNYNLNSSDEVLYISNNYNDITDVFNECKTYFINPDNSHPFFGPTIHDFQQIISIVKDPRFMMNINPKQNSKNQEYRSLKELDPNLLNKITYQVIHNARNNKPITLLEFVQNQKNINPKYSVFIDYIYYLKRAIKEYNLCHWWVAGYYFQIVVNIEQSQMEPWRRLAKCCSYLRHGEYAEFAYQMALSIKPDHYYTHLSAGYHFLMHGNIDAAKKMFISASKVSKLTERDKSWLVGYARICELSSDLVFAEKCYQKATNYNDTKSYEPAHFYYGIFLENQNRLSEAKEQFQICLYLSPKKIENHERMCDISWKLNQFESCKSYLKNMLNIDSHAPTAIYNYEMFHKESYIIRNVNVDYPNHVEQYNVYDFDSFWFDDIGIVDGDFNQYYDDFVKYKLNNMIWLLYDKAFANKLEQIIKIKNPKHLKLICSKIVEKRKFINNMCS